MYIGVSNRLPFAGHSLPISAIAWCNESEFVTASRDNTLRRWNIDSRQSIQILRGHTQAVNSVSLTRDGRIVSASDDGTVKLWDSDNDAVLLSLVGHRSPVRCVTVAAGVIVSGSADGTLGIWDLDSGSRIRTLAGHNGVVNSVTTTANGFIVSASRDHSLRVWQLEANDCVRVLHGHSNEVNCVVALQDGRVVSAADDATLRVWDLTTGETNEVLEGHTHFVAAIAVSPRGDLIASKSVDGHIRLWATTSWQCVGQIVEPLALGVFPVGLAFHPRDNSILASLGKECIDARIIELVLRIQQRTSHSAELRYSSAKIVVVGEANIGKSCLAMRLTEDRYPDDHEHGTTHGMRFWAMEAEDLHPSAKPPEGQRRDVVLWDFGGQDEYQLVHQMFLHDTTLALVLIDPTRGRAAFDEARDWNKRLEKHLGRDKAVKLLVGAKVDRPSKLIDLNSIEALKKECGFAAFLDLSAKTGRNTKKLRKIIADALDWDQMAKTSRPELFQRIRDEIGERGKRGEVVLLQSDLEDAISSYYYEHEEPLAVGGFGVEISRANVAAATSAVADQLAMQGVVAKTKLMGGDEALVLQLPVIERYAGALIIAARNNPRGAPLLEERLLGSAKRIPLPGMTTKDRLERTNERIVLECIVELMIRHGICFRHGGLLVFPTLFPASGTDDEKLPHSVSLYYDFTGAIDNIYASLISKLMVSEEFGEGRLRAGRVEFESGKQGVCGVRQIKRTGGLAHVDLFFSEKTKPDRKDLFTRFVEEHLRLHGVDIREHEAMTCKCGEQISERIVQTRISAGEKDVVCPICERKTLIGEGVDRIRKRNPETDAKMVALRKRIDEKLTEDIKSAKKAVAGDIRMAKTGDPIRILHLSDLHFTDKTNPDTKLRLLLQDIRQQDEDYLPIDTVEYLVISGDMTDKGKDVGFEKARQFVDTLVKELGLSVERCILVPGNHDVQDHADAYEEREGIDGKPMLVRHPENFQKRFEQFSNGFLHPLMHREYPLLYADQGISYLFPDTGIQFLTLNSAWEIDKNGRKKAGIHPDAAAGVVARAEDERKRAVEREDLRKTQPILRIGVWHHAVAGPELMSDLGFLTQLQKAGMQLCLHGDVHEPRTELYGHRRPGREVEILGAGSFGSLAEGRPESTPKLYNMLEVFVDASTKKHKSIRVHTRQQKTENESWQGYHEWPNPSGGRLPYFDIDLS